MYILKYSNSPGPAAAAAAAREDFWRQLRDAPAAEVHLGRGLGDLKHQIGVHHDVHLGTSYQWIA